MKSPFVKCSCGCIVIPLHRESERLKDHMDCILIKACDHAADDGINLSFHVRAIERWKVIRDPGYIYNNELRPLPVELDEKETQNLMDSISALLHLGQAAFDAQFAAERMVRGIQRVQEVESRSA